MIERNEGLLGIQCPVCRREFTAADDIVHAYVTNNGRRVFLHRLYVHAACAVTP